MTNFNLLLSYGNKYNTVKNVDLKCRSLRLSENRQKTQYKSESSCTIKDIRSSSKTEELVQIQMVC